MADIYGTIESLARSVQDSLTSKTIYGEPITAGAVTVVPVAEVQFGFGGGGGGGGGMPGDESDKSEQYSGSKLLSVYLLKSTDL